MQGPLLKHEAWLNFRFLAFWLVGYAVLALCLEVGATLFTWLASLDLSHWWLMLAALVCAFVWRLRLTDGQKSESDS